MDATFVKITGTRLNRFIEFEFSLNDADLTVELVLPPEAFEAFCLAQKATLLLPPPAVAEAVRAIPGPRGVLRRAGTGESPLRH